MALRWPRHVAIAFCGFIGFLLPAVYGIAVGSPEPADHDEFSYLLGADTFAHGRLTNPSPPLPEFFEAPHVLVVPTYNSKYPPGQAATLAVGQVFARHPIVGVWLSCGLFAASLCWMLQAWSSRQWALITTVLAVITIGTSSYWAQSYWGGMVPASGAALFLGGFRRILDESRIGPSILMAVGLVVLANTRPYEGLLLGAGPAVLLVRWLFRTRPAVSSFVLPASGVLLAGGLFMATYNRAVTGEFQQWPYAIHHQQYFHQGMFVFSQLRPPERQTESRTDAFYRYYLSPPVGGTKLVTRVTSNAFSRLVGAIGTPFGILRQRDFPGYQGTLLWLAVLAVVSQFRSTRACLVCAALAVTAECLLSRSLAVLLLIVLVTWIAAFMSTYRRNKWAYFLITMIIIMAVGQSIVLWWSPHYSAPIVPVVFAVVATTLQRIARRPTPIRISTRLGGGLLALSIVHFAALGTIAVASHDDAGKSRPWRRVDVLRFLETQPGSHLVFVHYDLRYDIRDEWVYNQADLNSAKVVFAHDLGAQRNSALMAKWSTRVVWIARLSPGATMFERYGRPQ